MMPLSVLAPGRGNILTGKPLPRSCGECQACCFRLAVVSIGKPYDCQCRDQSPAGCAVYPGRPPECREYACLWLCGAGAAADRPDRGGLLVNLHAEGGACFLDFHELRRGAFCALDQEHFRRLCGDARRLLAPYIRRRLAAVRVWPHGTPCVNGQPSGNGYPECITGVSLHRQTHPGSGVYLYLGPSRDGKLLVGGEWLDEATPGLLDRVFEEAAARMEGRENG